MDFTRFFILLPSRIGAFLGGVVPYTVYTSQEGKGKTESV